MNIKKILEQRCRYTIGDEVYHSTNSDSPRGIIIDILYNFRTDQIRYLVSFGIYNEEEVSVLESEISLTKSVI